MPVCAQGRAPTVAARIAHRSVFAVIHELHRGVSFDEREDVPAGEPAADGDGQNLHPSAVPPRVPERGWHPDSPAERPD